MTTAQKQIELAKVQTLINRITSNSSRKLKALDTNSKKMLLNTLNDLQAQKVSILNAIYF